MSSYFEATIHDLLSPEYHLIGNKLALGKKYVRVCVLNLHYMKTEWGTGCLSRDSLQGQWMMGCLQLDD